MTFSFQDFRLLPLGAGLAVAAVGALIVARRGPRSSAEAAQGESAGTLARITQSAMAYRVRAATAMAGSLALVLTFVYFLFPSHFTEAYQSRTFFPVLIGLVVVSMLRPIGSIARKVAGLLLCLFGLAIVSELWSRRPPASEHQVRTETPVTSNYSSQLDLPLPRDGSWSPWIDARNGRGITWSATGGGTFYVGIPSGRAYQGGISITPGSRFWRFRARGEDSVPVVLHLSGDIVSFADRGAVREPRHAELYPRGEEPPRIAAPKAAAPNFSDSVDIAFEGGRDVDTVQTYGHKVELQVIEGDGNLEVLDNDTGTLEVFQRIKSWDVFHPRSNAPTIQLQSFRFESKRVVVRVRARRP